MYLNWKLISSLNCLFLFPRRRTLTTSSSPFSTPSKSFSVSLFGYSSSSIFLFFFVWYTEREEKRREEKRREEKRREEKIKEENFFWGSNKSAKKKREIKREKEKELGRDFFSLFWVRYEKKPLFVSFCSKILSLFLLSPFFSPRSFTLFSNPRKNLFSSLSLAHIHTKIRRWMMKKNIQTKKQRNFLKVLRMEMKKLSKFFFLETKTNNLNLISTSSSKTRRFFFFFKLNFSLSLFLSFSLFYCSLSLSLVLIFILFLFLTSLFCSFFKNFFLLKGGKTALHLAASKGWEQIVKILVDHGSNVDLQTTVFFFDFWFFFLFLCVV